MNLALQGRNEQRPLAIVVGTRPEIIKMAPIINVCNGNGVAYELIHTGQHYSYEMDSLILRDLNLSVPKYNLRIGSGSHAEETAKALVGLEHLFRRIRPDVVLVQGDTNSTLAGALSAAKLHIPVGHVEAGLRSFDRQMPEETNRILTDHMSEFLFAPTDCSAKNLLSEGIPQGKIMVTGNTIVDTIQYAVDLLKKQPQRRQERSFAGSDFMLLTLHREENVDNHQTLRNIVQGVTLVAREFNMKVVFPAHPRTLKRLRQYRIPPPDSLHIIPPAGCLNFLQMEQDARMILTDSGGVQEEACILGTPCVTLRQSTERPETVDVGANFLSGTESKAILRAATVMMARPRKWPNPFGDGRAGLRIVEAISRMARSVPA